MKPARRTELAKRLALALVCAVITSALASALALQGKRYFYCATMGVVVEDPCVTSSSPEPDVALHEAHSDCCLLGHMRNLPQSALSEPLVVPLAAFVALPLPSPLATPPPAREIRIAERSTGPPPAGDRVHARLMVFLT